METTPTTTATWLQALSCLGLGFVICWALTGIILKRQSTGRSGDFHHGHKRPIPRLGGVGIVSAFLVVAVVILSTQALTATSINTLLIIVLSSAGMFALGLWDDFRPVGAKVKLLVQVAIASAVYFSNIRIEMLKLPGMDLAIPLGISGYFATVFWLVSLSNLINLIDGIDGLAGGICLMLMFLMVNLGAQADLGFSVLLPVGLIGALLAFLKFNYPPAKIYLGDGGAYLLGFLIGILSIVNSNKGSIMAALIAPAFALAIPIVDVSLAVLRRGARGLPIFRPDQKHIHHRLITLGISHEQTLLNLYTVSLLCLLLAFGIFYVQGRLLPLYTGLLFLVFIVAGHLSGFTKNWITFDRQWGESFGLRKQTQYALTLDRLLVMEAERSAGLNELWESYQQVVQKLGFAQVTVSSPEDAHRSWQAASFTETADAWHSAHEISDGTLIELRADKKSMSGTQFSLLGDLASETWYKAVKRWRSVNKLPLTVPNAEPLVSKETVPGNPLA